MKRYEIYEVRGRRFALALTLASQMELEETYGDDVNIGEILYNGDRKKIYENALKMLEIMANEGAAYAELFEDKKFDRTTADEMKHFLKLSDINMVREKLTNACVLGWKRDIELEEDASKNAEAPGD